MRSRALLIVGLLFTGGSLSGRALAEEKPAAPAPEAANTQTVLLVKGFEFKGNTVFSNETLAGALAEFVGKPLDPTQLPLLAGRVSALYRDRGFLASAVASQPAGGGGVVAVAITESTLGSVTVEGNKRYSGDFLSAHFARLQRQQVWSVDSLERSLLLLQDCPGVERVRSTLRKGSTPGTTDIAVTIEEREKQLHGVSEINNSGSTYASRERLIQRLTYDNATGRGDLTSLQLVTAPNPSDLLMGRLGFQMPVNGEGTKLSAYVLNGDFEVGQEFKALQMKGSGFAYGIAVTHPVLKSRRRTLLGEVGLDVKDEEMKVLGTKATEDKIRVLRIGATYNDLEEQGAVRNLASLYIYRGLGDLLGGMPDKSPLASRRGADGRFTKITLEGARLQKIDDRTLAVGRVSAQFADNNLVAGEQMTLGGVDSVRGYPQSESLGDTGYQASVEFRFNDLLEPSKQPEWLQALQGVAFLDYGRYAVKDAVVGQSGSGDLIGAGLGIRSQFAQQLGGLSLRLDLGYALKEGPSKASRFQPYLQLMRSF